ncbi:MAG: hypothetical protein L6V93_08295 [Clostridiales bacterium]|nr:MAG: hypothetical protein L6V93_08295 [Clostridiales bacterium]
MTDTFFDAYVSKTSVDGKVIEIGKDNTDRMFVTIGEKRVFYDRQFLCQGKR